MRHHSIRRAPALRYSFILISSLALGPSFAAETIVGRASVTDGDTLEIRGTRIRLHGVDAPESAQLCKGTGKVAEYRCGQQAANALADKIGQANVSCEEKDKDRYGRTVAVCSVGGEDLNRWLVSEGHALAYRQYGGGIYDAEEKAAKRAQRGIWAGSFEAPWDWRKQKRSGGKVSNRNRREDEEEIATPTEQDLKRAGPGQRTANAGCKIKGNIGNSGKIYHTPESASYAATKIDEGKGERMFCSEEEAKAAGWRAAN